MKGWNRGGNEVIERKSDLEAGCATNEPECHWQQVHRSCEEKAE